MGAVGQVVVLGVEVTVIEPVGPAIETLKLALTPSPLVVVVVQPDDTGA